MFDEHNILVPHEFIKNNKKVDEWAKKSDLIIEIVDARIAYSGANLLDYKNLHHAKRMILFSNALKADPIQTAKWIEYYREKGIYCEVLQENFENENDVDDEYLEKFNKLLENYVQKQVLIIGLPKSMKEGFVNKLETDSGTFEKPKIRFFIRDKIYVYNNVNMIISAPITGINYTNPKVYWHTQMLGIFNIPENLEIVAIKTFKLLLKKYEEKLENAYSLNLTNKQSFDDIVKEFIRLMSSSVPTSEGETPDLGFACNYFLENVKSGKKITHISLEFVEDYHDK